MRKKFNIQRFAEENIIKTTDIEPAISVDLTTRLAENIKTLRKVMGITQMDPMAEGTIIKIYKVVQNNTPEQVAEGEIIPLTNIERKLDRTIELTLDKYRKVTTAEAIQRSGRKNSVNVTDTKLMSSIRKNIKTKFFDILSDGTGTASGANLQKATSAAWGKLQKYYDDMDATPIYFMSSEDVADYLGEKPVTTQTLFGMTYIENFLGLGDTFVTPSIEKGKVIATVKENLHCAYTPAASGEVGKSLDLIGDETGFVGMRHSVDEKTAGVQTLALSSTIFYPELLDGVIVSTIGGESNGGQGDHGDQGDQGNP